MHVRHTASLTLLIATAAAIIALPSPPHERADNIDPLRLSLVKVDARLRHASELLRREHSRALATAAVASAPKQPGALVFVRQPDASALYEQRMRSIAEHDFASLPRHESGIRTIIVLAVDTGSAVDGLEAVQTRSSMVSVDVFPPGSIAKDVCVAVARAHYRGVLQAQERYWAFVPERWHGTFNACQWYAAFGTPGRGVSTWLDSTRFAPIQVNDFWAWNWLSPWDRIDFRGDAPRAWTYADPSRYAMAGCVDGRAESCAKLLLANIEQANAGAQILTSGWIGTGRSYGIAPNVNAAALLNRLERGMGAEQFAQLWKSELPVPEAFRSIRGGSLTKWIRDQTIAVSPTGRVHALPSAATLIALLIAIAAPVFLGLRSVSRRSGFT